MNLKLVILLVTASVAVAVAEKARFDNYRVYKVDIESVDQLKVLQYIENNPDGYLFWEPPANVDTQVSLVVPPHKFGEFGEFKEQYGFNAELQISNLQEQIDLEDAAPTKAGFGWTSYHTLAEIYSWMDELVAKYPKVVSKIIGGSTYEGRKIAGIKISYKSGNKGIFIDGNIHAREWITSATVTWIMNELLTSADNTVRKTAESFDWYFFPVINPDGFVYTKTNNRMWRKTRSKPQGGLCAGADPNRNWAYKFMEGGASSNPCSDTYAGPYAFSEIETKSLSDFYKSLSNISTYISFHSYSQLLLLPYGHTTAPLDNYRELMEIGTKAIKKLKERYGTVYKAGNIAEAIYIATGGSMDWVKGVIRTPVTYTYELRDTGRYGFVLPPDQIIPTALETFDSLLVIIEEAKKYGYH